MIDQKLIKSVAEKVGYIETGDGQFMTYPDMQPVYFYSNQSMRKLWAALIDAESRLSAVSEVVRTGTHAQLLYADIAEREGSQADRDAAAEQGTALTNYEKAQNDILNTDVATQ